jgi:alpha-ribazole phosphatase
LRIALVRHPAPLIAPGICYGRLDIPLSPDGVAAFAGIVAQLTDFPAEKLWSSPAQRCMALAEAIAPSRGLPRQVDARLLELDFGNWEGVAWDDVPRDALDRWASDPLAFAPPGGESGADLIARVTSFHADLVSQGRDCVVVSHGGPLKLLAALLRGAPMDLLAAAPAQASVHFIQTASADSTTHSTTSSVAPRTSPV